MGVLSIADIDRWSAGDVREVFHAARSRAEAVQEASDGLATLPMFQTWDGAAAEAAKNSIEATRRDLDAHGREALAVAMAADRAADAIEAVKAKLAALRADCDAAHMRIDPVTNTVVAAESFRGNNKLFKDQQAELQPRLEAILGEANTTDEELAVAIDMADGDIPIADKDTVGPDGLTQGQVGIDAAQQQQRLDAFRQVYGRDPVSANDWRMAAALDPHSYDPRYRGTPPNIVVGRFKPVPGGGMYRQNMYIPAEEVQNVELNSRLIPHMAGDNRGPSALIGPESSRVSVFADMDSGLLVVRQNPTMSTDGVDAGAGTPTVSALQGPDGRLMINYTATDPFEPLPAKLLGVSVTGQMMVVPGQDGNLSAGGVISAYPNTEAYSYKPDGTITQLFSREVSSSQVGVFNLATDPDVGIGTTLGTLNPSQPIDGRPLTLPPTPTILGSAASPPVISVVPLPGTEAPPPPLPSIPVAAPPGPVPTPPPLPPQ